MNLTLEFQGGAELLFDNLKQHVVSLPTSDGESWDVGKLLNWIKLNLLKESPDLFIQGPTVRPGILVLINDQDWELCGGLKYQIQENDHIVFISTLHGG